MACPIRTLSVKIQGEVPLPVQGGSGGIPRPFEGGIGGPGGHRGEVGIPPAPLAGGATPRRKSISQVPHSPLLHSWQQHASAAFSCARIPVIDIPSCLLLYLIILRLCWGDCCHVMVHFCRHLPDSPGHLYVFEATDHHALPRGGGGCSFCVCGLPSLGGLGTMNTKYAAKELVSHGEDSDDHPPGGDGRR